MTISFTMLLRAHPEALERLARSLGLPRAKGKLATCKAIDEALNASANLRAARLWGDT